MVVYGQRLSFGEQEYPDGERRCVYHIHELDLRLLLAPFPEPNVCGAQIVKQRLHFLDIFLRVLPHLPEHAPHVLTSCCTMGTSSRSDRAFLRSGAILAPLFSVSCLSPDIPDARGPSPGVTMRQPGGRRGQRCGEEGERWNFPQ
eukprot:CAMPEP_0180154768 /NCGR_PEP_ID=MMETSP0986-20121125/24376_1 /TAXON_ID=697907 /ORGANISM="non described non described, Strain CCMP2293" /LENGTH=144 /DNA_ID=CAMNT_0022103227 /DNA_START=237 /DNA_END=669 /DNA_ORIENTATION=-